MPKDDRPITVRVTEVLRDAPEPPTLAAVCRKLFGRAGTEERAAVYVVLHRMRAGGTVRKNDATWEYTGPDKKPMRRVSVKG